jgi:signal transduction histidine kinase
MIVLHLVYGGSFVATGIALGFQARLAVRDEPIPRRALWLLASFLVVHGAGDLAGVSCATPSADGVMGPVRLVGLALLGLSFALLLAFGIGLLQHAAGRRMTSLTTVVVALAAWSALVVAALRASPSAPTGAFADGLEAATRYGLGAPAAIAAALGARAAAVRAGAEDWSAAVLVRGAALVFGAYAVMAGIVVPAAPFPPASAVNELAFQQALLVPPGLLRGACAIGVGLLLSEAFIRGAVRRMRSEVEHLRDGFIALVAHDLRTPLNAVETGAWLIERLPPRSSGTDQEHRGLQTIRSSVRTMRRIVDDLLQASLLDMKRLVVKLEPIDARALVARTADAVAEAVPTRRIAVEVPAELPRIFADPVRLEQVLGNLLSNAVKYSPPGSAIRIGAAAKGSEVVVSVTNEGEGIPAHDLPRIFSRHYRTRSAERGRAEGLGLGLYIAQGLVEAHGGRIWAESEPGRSATFRFTVPIAAQGSAGYGKGAGGERPAASRDLL